MDRIAERDRDEAARRRSYRSELREQQADGTRARILDATTRVMARGIASVSVPAVAREAGVSIPTVYRHFRTKADLLSALYPHLVRRAGMDDVPPPSSVGDLRTSLRAIFERLDALDDLGRAAIASPGGDEARRLSMPGRIALGKRLAASIESPLPDEDRERLARVLVVLTTSSALRVWRDYLGATVEDAADDIDWVVRAAIARGRSTTEP